MKQYRITNPRYSGEVVAVYNDNGMLETVSFAEADLSASQRNGMKSALPVYEEKIGEAFVSEGTVIVSEDVVISFDMFWEKFDNKYNRARCEQLWGRLTQTEKAQAYFNIPNYKKHLGRTNQYQMHPDTWLRNKLFNDYKK